MIIKCYDCKNQRPSYWGSAYAELGALGKVERQEQTQGVSDSAAVAAGLIRLA